MYKKHYELSQDFSQLIKDRKQMREEARKQCYYKKRHT